MIDTSKLPASVLMCAIELGKSKEDLEVMDGYSIIEMYLHKHGVIGKTHTIIDAVMGVSRALK